MIDGGKAMKIRWQYLVVFSLVISLSSLFLVTKASLKKNDQSSHLFTPEVVVVHQDGLLSIEETVGLSLLGETRPSHLFKRANPGAKEELYRLLDTDDDGLYWFQANAYWILGYIGDSNDAKRMQKTLKSFSGVLTAAQQNKVIAIFYSLGLMSRRGVTTSSDILDEMTDLKYWLNSFKWRPDELVTPNHLTAELESLVWVMLAQTIAGHRDDLSEIRFAILDQISVPERRKVMAEEIDSIRMKCTADEIFRDEPKVPTADEYTMLKQLYDVRETRLRSESDAYKERPASRR
jgi:hypothetical protein